MTAPTRCLPARLTTTWTWVQATSTQPATLPQVISSLIKPRADVTIAAANPAAARTYTFPDEGGDRDITLDPPTQASTVQYVRQVSSAGVGTWVDTSTLPGLWQEDSGNLSPVTLSHTLSIGTRNSNGAKFRVQLENDDETVYFYGGGSRGLRINDETEVNEGDHTIFEKNTDSGRYSFRNSTGELVQIEKDGSVTLANGTGQLNAGKGVFTRWVQIEPEYGIRMTGSSKNRIELRKEDYISGISDESRWKYTWFRD